MNGHSLLGVKLSEAQSYLIKTSDYVHMVICDGFNVPLQQEQQQQQQQSSNGTPKPPLTASSSAPFPKPPPQPPARQFTSLNNNLPKFESSSNGTSTNSVNTSTTTTTTSTNNKLNGNHSEESPLATSGKKPQPAIPTKLPLTTSTSNCNYDNLRNIDSDESRLTSPEVVNNYSFNGNNTNNGNSTSKMTNSQSFTKSKPVTPASNPVPPSNATNSITDKSIMNNIMNKCNNFDPKSQSMLTTTNTDSNGNSVRFFKKIKLFNKLIKLFNS